MGKIQDKDIQRITVIDRKKFKLKLEDFKYLVKETYTIHSQDYFYGYFNCLFVLTLIGVQTHNKILKYINKMYRKEKK